MMENERKEPIEELRDLMNKGYVTGKASERARGPTTAEDVFAGKYEGGGH